MKVFRPPSISVLHASMDPERSTRTPIKTLSGLVITRLFPELLPAWFRLGINHFYHRFLSSPPSPDGQDQGGPAPSVQYRITRRYPRTLIWPVLRRVAASARAV